LKGIMVSRPINRF